MKGAVLLAVVLGWLGVGTASAADNTCSTSSWDKDSMCPDEGAASVAVHRASGDRVAQLMSTGGHAPGSLFAKVVHDKNTGCFKGATVPVASPTYELDIIYRCYPKDKTCSARPPTSGGFFQSGAQSSCSDGCRYDRGKIVARMVLGAKVYYQASDAKPTGDTCTYDATKDDTPVTDDQCQQTGTLTQCVTKDGKHCAVASTGKKFCWQPTETGTKVSGNEAATKAPEGTAISPPPKPPTDGGEWQNSGSGSVSAGGGGTTNNYNVNNWNSNGNGSGNGGGNGNGEGGSGNESGGKDDGDGKGDKPGAGVGELYKGTDKTVAGLMGNFYSKASNAQVMKSITNFMGINSAGGSCPVFTVPASAFWDAMTFDAHCSGTWLQLLQTMGWIVLAIAAYVAVRIAVT